MARHTATDGQVGSQSHHPRAEQWPVLLEEFDVHFLMLDTERDSELLTLFQAHPAWVIDSQDDQSVLLVRTDVGSSAASSTSRR